MDTKQSKDQENVINVEFYKIFGQLQEFYRQQIVLNGGHLPQMKGGTDEVDGTAGASLSSTPRLINEQPIQWSDKQRAQLKRMNAIEDGLRRVTEMVDSLRSEILSKDYQLKDCQISLQSKNEQIKKLKKKAKKDESKSESNPKVTELKNIIKEMEKTINGLNATVKSKDDQIFAMREDNNKRFKENENLNKQIFIELTKKGFDKYCTHMTRFLNNDQKLSIKDKDKELITKELKGFRDLSINHMNASSSGKNTDSRSDGKKVPKFPLKTKNYK